MKLHTCANFQDSAGSLQSCGSATGDAAPGPPGTLQ